MKKRLAALDSPASAPAQPRPSRLRARLRDGLVVLVAGAVGVGAWQSGWLTSSGPAKVLTHDTFSAHAVSARFGPKPHLLSHPHRLLAAVPGPAGAGGYVFMRTQADGSPVRFDPCQPIRYVISGAEPFAGANAIVRSAIAEVSAATGLRFVDAGVTAEPASGDRSPYQPSRYGNRWAPALIAWTDATTETALKGHVVGIGGPDVAQILGKLRFVSGIVYLDAPDLISMRRGKQGQTLVHAVVLHELGHLVGLEHVKSKQNIMYPDALPLAHYGVGDLRGLAILGRGPCYNSV